MGALARAPTLADDVIDRLGGPGARQRERARRERVIDLNHEALRGSQGVSDEAPEQRHLPAKHDAQAAPANASPK